MSHQSADQEVGKIFVGGLSRSTTDESLFNFFSQFGEVTDHIVMKDRVDHMSRGFGFVTFADANAVDLVLSDRRDLDGKRIDCKRAVTREAGRGPSLESNLGGDRFKVFVGGLPRELVDNELEEHFKQFGPTEQAVIKRDPAGVSRGFGFVFFRDQESVANAIHCCADQKLVIEGRECDVRRCLPRNQNQNQNDQQRGASRSRRSGPIRGGRRGDSRRDSYNNGGGNNGFHSQNQFGGGSMQNGGMMGGMQQGMGGMQQQGMSGMQQQGMSGMQHGSMGGMNGMGTGMAMGAAGAGVGQQQDLLAQMRMMQMQMQQMQQLVMMANASSNPVDQQSQNYQPQMSSSNQSSSRFAPY